MAYDDSTMDNLNWNTFHNCIDHHIDLDWPFVADIAVALVLDTYFAFDCLVAPEYYSLFFFHLKMAIENIITMF